jgi:hypothetical protein
MVVGITLFEVFQKTLYYFTSRGKDGQANQYEENPLKEREKEAKDSQSDEDPPDDHHSNSFEFIHRSISLFNTGSKWFCPHHIKLMEKIKQNWVIRLHLFYDHPPPYSSPLPTGQAGIYGGRRGGGLLTLMLQKII